MTLVRSHPKKDSIEVTVLVEVEDLCRMCAEVMCVERSYPVRPDSFAIVTAGDELEG
ncbi:MAG: hypothetical protein R3344_03405 [Acidobacteriota bacterium]|nr:hypothetical protein [Acidobacteriota bacterium]